MKTALIIGTRGSELAHVQAGIVRHALQAVEPKLQIQVKIIRTYGDVNQQPIPLHTIRNNFFTNIKNQMNQKSNFSENQERNFSE